MLTVLVHIFIIGNSGVSALKKDRKAAPVATCSYLRSGGTAIVAATLACCSVAVRAWQDVVSAVQIQIRFGVAHARSQRTC